MSAKKILQPVFVLLQVLPPRCRRCADCNGIFCDHSCAVDIWRYSSKEISTLSKRCCSTPHHSSTPNAQREIAAACKLHRVWLRIFGAGSCPHHHEKKGSHLTSCNAQGWTKSSGKPTVVQVGPKRCCSTPPFPRHWIWLLLQWTNARLLTFWRRSISETFLSWWIIGGVAKKTIVVFSWLVHMPYHTGLIMVVSHRDPNNVRSSVPDCKRKTSSHITAANWLPSRKSFGLDFVCSQDSSSKANLWDPAACRLELVVSLSLGPKRVRSAFVPSLSRKSFELDFAATTCRVCHQDRPSKTILDQPTWQNSRVFAVMVFVEMATILPKLRFAVIGS